MGEIPTPPDQITTKEILEQRVSILQKLFQNETDTVVISRNLGICQILYTPNEYTVFFPSSNGKIKKGGSILFSLNKKGEIKDKPKTIGEKTEKEIGDFSIDEALKGLETIKVKRHIKIENLADRKKRIKEIKASGSHMGQTCYGMGYFLKVEDGVEVRGNLVRDILVNGGMHFLLGGENGCELISAYRKKEYYEIDVKELKQYNHMLNEALATFTNGLEKAPDEESVSPTENELSGAVMASRPAEKSTLDTLRGIAKDVRAAFQHIKKRP